MPDKSIALISFWYNEEFLAPHFLHHYRWVDSIYIILDSKTNDGTESVLRNDERVTISRHVFENGYDDAERAAVFNKALADLGPRHQWIGVCDADEFVYCQSHAEPRDFLTRAEADVVYARLWQSEFRESDKPLVVGESILLQRPFVDPNRIYNPNRLYHKPIFFRSGNCWELSIGNHSFRCRFPARVARRCWYGLHFANGDRYLWDRRAARRAAHSRRNLEQGWGGHQDHALACEARPVPERWVLFGFPARVVDALNAILDRSSLLFGYTRYAIPDQWHWDLRLDVLDMLFATRMWSRRNWNTFKRQLAKLKRAVRGIN